MIEQYISMMRLSMSLVPTAWLAIANTWVEAASHSCAAIPSYDI